MYILAPDGNYTYENPPTYDAAPKRAVDYQNISFLTTQGGYIGPLPGDPSKAAYAGPHFLKTEGGSLAGLNEPLYRDVFAQFNSDFPFLIDQVQNHGLTTKGATAANLARFHNRIAGAIHRAAPGEGEKRGEGGGGWGEAIEHERDTQNTTSPPPPPFPSFSQAPSSPPPPTP